MSERALRSTVFLLAVCLAAASLVPGGSLTAGATSQPDDPLEANEDVEVDADAVVLRVDVRPDGSAVWTVEHRVKLDDEETRRAFEDLQADLEENRSAYVDRFERRMNDTVAAARERTGREMALENATVSAETRTLPQEYGVLTYRFEWTGFAAVDGTAIAAGDALSGFFLDSETNLLVSWPAGYALQEATPDPSERRDRTVVWTGPKDFGADEPRLVVDSDAAGVGGADGDGTDAATGDGIPLAPVGAAVLLVGLVVALFAMRRRGGPLPVGGSAGAEPAADEGADAPEASTAPEDGDGEDDADDGPPAELLSNEEQVLRLLEDNGGRIKQQDVVQTLGWTDAKTSQVVSRLREEDEIESFRIGRENVLVLPDVADEMDV